MALNFFGIAAGAFLIILRGTPRPFFMVVFLPDNSLTLKILLFGLPVLFGMILPPFLLAIMSVPLSTSNPTGGANKSSLFNSGIGSGVVGAVSSKVTTELNMSSRNSSGVMFVLLLLSSFLSKSSPTETININLCILR